MTLQQALREDNFMKPIRGFENEKVLCKEALIQHIRNIYSDFEKERPSKKNRTPRNFVIPDKGIPEFRSYMDVREFLLTKTIDSKGKALTFNFEDKIVKISTKGVPYWANKNGTPDLSFTDAGRFFKTLYNYKFLLEEAIQGGNNAENI